MKLIKKKAEFIGYTVYSVGIFPEWRCPNKDCGMSVMEEYKCCPYCGQYLKFVKNSKNKLKVNGKRRKNTKRFSISNKTKLIY